jgi:mono/diheme cytochrome c family protein
VLSDAGGEGHVGPSLDGDSGLTKELIVSRVTNGQGPMPGFGGQMSDEEIATLAEYVVTVSKK